MAIESVKAYFEGCGMGDRVIELAASSATVELAAQALGCGPERIAKTLSFHVNDRVVLVVAAGDAKIDNRKYRDQFGVKAKMLEHQEAEPLVGHGVGGVCPFAVNSGVDIYLDVSLKRFNTVFPAAGSANSAIELDLQQLETHAFSKQWVDVCKGWNE